jgi:hypothetical protein
MVRPLVAIQGVYRDGKIGLQDTPQGIAEDTPVIVTFIQAEDINLQARGIDEVQAADLRARLSTFTDEWESPEMSAYDNYDTAKAKL